MLEEHSGGNYPFPSLDPRGNGINTYGNDLKDRNSNLQQPKQISNSAESLNNKSANIAPSKYYHTDHLALRYTYSIVDLKIPSFFGNFMLYHINIFFHL
jgi:hypothetical protein